jgi:hypothetical protein
MIRNEDGQEKQDCERGMRPNGGLNTTGSDTPG